MLSVGSTQGTFLLPLSDSNNAYMIRPPTKAELIFNPTGSRISSQGGLVVNIHSIDDIDAVWSFHWDDLSQQEVNLLEQFYNDQQFALDDPLDLLSEGYIEAFDYAGIKGQTDQNGEPSYQANLTFRLQAMKWPDVLPELLEGYHYQKHVGVSVRGDQPLYLSDRGGYVEGSEPADAGVSVDVDGFMHLSGDEQTATWAPSEPVRGADGSYDNSARVAVDSAGPTVRYGKLKSRILPPGIGTTYLALKPQAQSLLSDGSESDMWVPGDAGAKEFILLGHGQGMTLSGESWLLYARQQYLVAEFWRNGVWVTARALDMTSLVEHGNLTYNPLYLLAMGYDFTNGQLTLAASVLSEIASDSVLETFEVPALVEFGYNAPEVYLGGGPVDVEYTDPATLAVTTETRWKSASAHIKAVQGTFASNRSLNAGYLAELRGILRQQEESKERG